MAFGLLALVLPFNLAPTSSAGVGLSARLLIIAGLLDGIDGPVARVLRGESRVGRQLDSLADIVNFGAAAAVLYYRWGFARMDDGCGSFGTVKS